MCKQKQQPKQDHYVGFFNYKVFSGVALLAICDAKYTFNAVSVGQYGSNDNRDVVASSEMGYVFENDTIHMPHAEEKNVAH